MRTLDSSLEMCAERLRIDPDELVGGLNLTQAARLLGIAASTLRERALAGKIGAQRDGKRWIFFWWHLEEYLEAREFTPRPCENRTAGRIPGKSKSKRGLLPPDVEKEAKAMGLI